MSKTIKAICKGKSLLQNMNERKTKYRWNVIRFAQLHDNSYISISWYQRLQASITCQDTTDSTLELGLVINHFFIEMLAFIFEVGKWSTFHAKKSFVWRQISIQMWFPNKRQDNPYLENVVKITRIPLRLFDVAERTVDYQTGVLYDKERCRTKLKKYWLFKWDVMHALNCALFFGSHVTIVI